jgi:polysaccharide export outer membrane protein
MKKYFAPTALMLNLIFAGLVQTQEPQSASSQNLTRQSGSDVDNQGIRNYLLGPGDTLDVKVFGQPDMNAVVEVDSDGNISSLPFLDTPIYAKCRTGKEVQKDILKAYRKYIQNPQVTVRIAELKSRPPATVFGAVRQPARVQMQRKVRLNELMVVSGGFTDRASGTIQIFHTEPLMCPQPGQEALAKPIDERKAPVEIVKISELRSGKGQSNPVVWPGDIVLVTEAEPVYITGSVVSPQGIFLRDQLTLSRALAMVGGVRKEAKTNEVRVYRQKPGATTQELIRVDYAAIKKNQKPDFFLQAFDIIEVPEAGIFSGPRLWDTVIGAVSGSMGNMFSNGGSQLVNRIIVY